ncbi:serine palmitoyltransferase subunit 1 [Capsaspora owczarzaki ATCC 30864]|nr:serine palmitoyltransferase subunit 1 [Capsaspora owczarzaki ATCC 30864]|eukprot:XP_004344499.1 serine palmitoyltransferase subunit 1 [Capsaspora owczarzaki ATCC 30864]
MSAADADMVAQLSLLEIANLLLAKLLSYVPSLPSHGPIFELLHHAFYEAPAYHLILEGLLVLSILWLVVRKSDKSKDKGPKLTAKEVEEIIAEWQPEPLVPVSGPEPVVVPVVQGPAAAFVQIDGQKKINLASFNFLNFVGNKKVEDAAVTSLKKYGVGSCGPRGFYGTIDVHLELESKLAKFTQTEEAVLYSYAFSTVASVIPAYSKRGDILFVDEAISFPLAQGVLASRSTVKYFKHNDMADLERLLIEQQREDAKLAKKAKLSRRFVVVEGLYANTAEIAPLKRLVELKWQYKVRIMLDETFSFGVLGDHGRGITEHFGISPEDIDIMTSSLEHAVGSIGGFSYGKTFVMDHQRLSSQGYCFSASLPPLLASAALCALEAMEKSPDMFTTLRSRSKAIHAKLSTALGRHLVVSGDASAPMKFLTVKQTKGRAADEALLDLIVSKANDKNVVLTRARYIEDYERVQRPPAIRIALNIGHSEGEVENAIRDIAAAADEAAKAHSS